MIHFFCPPSTECPANCAWCVDVNNDGMAECVKCLTGNVVTEAGLCRGTCALLTAYSPPVFYLLLLKCFFYQIDNQCRQPGVARSGVH